MALEVVSPVPPTLALAFGGVTGLRRKVLLHQVRTTEAAAVLHAGDPVMLAMFDRSRRRRAEVAIAFAAGAGRHARALAVLSHLTCACMAETGVLVFTRIAPAFSQAQRLALMAGFVPGGFKDPAIWIWRKH